MKTYTVTITATENIEVEADSEEEASLKVPQELADRRFGLWDMVVEWEVEPLDEF
jgi:hypothetical protein